MWRAEAGRARAHHLSMGHGADRAGVEHIWCMEDGEKMGSLSPPWEVPSYIVRTDTAEA